MSYKYTYIDPTERTRIEGIIQSSLRDRNMELAFVRQQQIQKATDKQNKVSTKQSKQKDTDLKELLKKIPKEQLYLLLKQVQKWPS